MSENTWQVTVDLDVSGMSDELLGHVGEQLSDNGAAVAGQESHLSVVLTIEAETVFDAGQSGYDLVLEAVEEAGVEVEATLGVEAITAEEADRRLAEPAIPALVAAADAADLLGVSRQRIHQLRGEDVGFPEPVDELKQGPLWTRASIEAFGRDRKPRGRPKLRGVPGDSVPKARGGQRVIRLRS